MSYGQKMGFLSTIGGKIADWVTGKKSATQEEQAKQQVTNQARQTIPDFSSKTNPSSKIGTTDDLISWAKSNPHKLDALIAQNPRARILREVINNPAKLQALQKNNAQTETSNFDAKQFSSSRIQLVADSGAGSMPRVIELKLENGIRVLVVPDSSSNQVSLTAQYSVGSNQDIKPGTAHLLEHMLGGRAATSSFGKSEISDLYEYNGAKIQHDWQAGTNRDITMYAGSLDPSLIELLFKIESERMDQANLDDIDTELKLEKSTIETEIDQVVNDSSGYQIEDAFRSLAIPESIYNNNVIGTKESVQSITKQDLKDFYRHYQDPKNLTLIIAGNVGEPARLEHLLLNYFANKQKPEKPVIKREEAITRPPVSSVKGQKEISFKKSGDEKILSLGYFGPNISERDNLVLGFIRASLMGRGPKSRLLKKLADSTKINVGVGMNPFPAKGNSLFSLNVSVDKIVDLDELKVEVKKILQDIKEKGLTAEEIEQIRQDTKYSEISRQEDPKLQATVISHHDIWGNWQAGTNVVQQIQGISNEDIMRVAQDLFKDENEYTVKLLPSEEKSKANKSSASQQVDKVRDINPERLQSLTEAIVGKNTVKAPDLQLRDLGQVIINENHRLPKASIRLQCLGQPLSEKDRIITDILESLFVQSGTLKHDKDQLFDQFRELGSDHSFGVGHDGVYFDINAITLGDNLAKALELFRETLLEARLDPETFTGVKGLLKNSIREEYENPMSAAFNQVLNKAFPVGHPNHVATREERWQLVDSIQYDDVIQFWNKIKNSNFVIAASGDVKPEQITQVQSIINEWSQQAPRDLGAGTIGAHKTDIQELEGFEYKGVQETAHVVLGRGVGVKSTDPDFYPLLLANLIMGGPILSSRLLRTVRESQGNVYSANSMFHNFINNDGRFLIAASTRKGNGHNLANQLKELVSKFPDDISEAELKMAKQFYIKSYMKDHFTNNAAIADTLVGMRLKNRNYSFIQDLPRMIEEDISLEDVKNAVKKHMNMDGLQLAIADEKLSINGQEVDTKFDAKKYKAQHPELFAPPQTEVKAAQASKTKLQQNTPQLALAV